MKHFFIPACLSVIAVALCLQVPNLAAARSPGTASYVYLPLIAKTPDATVRADFGYSDGGQTGLTKYWVSGSVVNHTTEPLAVVLKIDLIMYVQILEPTPVTITVYPIFEATLPDQDNPFSYTWFAGYKVGYTYVRTKVVSATPLTGAYYSLVIEDWKETDTDIVGHVKNTTEYLLGDVRVIGIQPQGILKVAQLDQTILKSGESATFHFDYNRHLPVNVISQGAVLAE